MPENPLNHVIQSLRRIAASHDDFLKYPRTPHLFGSRGTDDDKHLGEKESSDFIADGTNTMHQTRKRWIDLFADYDARVELVYVEPALPVILEQNARRAKPVPKKVIQHLLQKLEPPTLAETHSVIVVG